MRRPLCVLLALVVALAQLGSAGAAVVAHFDDAAVTAPMVDGVNRVSKGTTSITPVGGGGDGAALVELTLTGMRVGVEYHVIAYCTVGPLAGCQPIQYVPGLTDYIHDLGRVKADARGRIDASYLVEGLPDDSYGWHVVAAIPGYERYAIVTGNIGRHTHNEEPHELPFDVTLTLGSLCDLTKEYVDKVGVANSLCAKLRAADAAATRGQDGPHDSDLDAYIQEVEAQTGKSITPAHAAVLERLATQLKGAPLAPATPHRGKSSPGSKSPSGRERS